MDLIEDIHNYLEHDLKQLNHLIISYLNSKEELIELVSNHLIGGKSKRIRPILTILVAKMFNCSNKDVINLAAAVEFIHTATLLHDDVVDDSKMRRFKPTANLIWGNKASILVGDFLFSQSFKLMVATNSLQALTSLSNAAAIIAQGEVAQLEKLNQKSIINNHDYHRIIEAKTAELFGAACEVGGIVAGQNHNMCESLKILGINLGNIFQIADDSLDYFSENGKIGKNIGDDFLEGKVTLPLIMTYEKSNKQEKKAIEDMIRSDHRSKEEFEWILNKMTNYSIKDQILKYLDNLKFKTLETLIKTLPANKAREYLVEIVNFAMQRTY